jgi:hypothetical protein
VAFKDHRVIADFQRMRDSLARSQLSPAKDNAQRTGADAFINHRDQTAVALEIYSPGEPGMKAVCACLNLVADADEHHPG